MVLCPVEMHCGIALVSKEVVTHSANQCKRQIVVDLIPWKVLCFVFFLFNSFMFYIPAKILTKFCLTFPHHHAYNIILTFRCSSHLT